MADECWKRDWGTRDVLVRSVVHHTGREGHPHLFATVQQMSPRTNLTAPAPGAGWKSC